MSHKQIVFPLSGPFFSHHLQASAEVSRYG